MRYCILFIYWALVKSTLNISVLYIENYDNKIDLKSSNMKSSNMKSSKIIVSYIKLRDLMRYCILFIY